MNQEYKGFSAYIADQFIQGYTIQVRDPSVGGPSDEWKYPEWTDMVTYKPNCGDIYRVSNPHYLFRVKPTIETREYYINAKMKSSLFLHRGSQSEAPNLRLSFLDGKLIKSEVI